MSTSMPRNNQDILKRRPKSPVDDHRDGVIAGVLEFLCNKKGFSASWDELSSYLSVPSGKLKEIAFELKFIRGMGSTARLDMDLTLCLEFIESPTGCIRPDCTNLHICPKYIHSTCDLAPDDCDLGHSFTTKHNGSVLQKYGICSIPANVLLLVFSRLCNEFIDPSQLPDFCGGYNGQGCSSGDSACSNFHICEKFIMSDGEVLCDGSCDLNHKTLKANVKRLLDAANFDTNLSEKELRFEFKQLMKKKVENMGKATTSTTSDKATTSGSENKAPPNSSQDDAQPCSSSAPDVHSNDDGNVDKLEVCLSFLNLDTSKKDLRPIIGVCGGLHSDQLYQWQVKSDTSSKIQWFNFCMDHNVQLENAFCKPDVTSTDVDYLDPSHVDGNFSNIFSLLGFDGPSPPTWTADFGTMLLEDDDNTRQLEIRRLGTPSSVVSGDQWATTWLWYFIDTHGKWTEYGALTPHDASTSHQSDITSADIETAYQAHLNGKGNPVIPFKTERYNYEIQFTRKPMVQKNMGPKFFTEREVRRRPKMITYTALKEQAQ